MLLVVSLRSSAGNQDPEDSSGDIETEDEEVQVELWVVVYDISIAPTTVNRAGTRKQDATSSFILGVTFTQRLTEPIGWDFCGIHYLCVGIAAQSADGDVLAVLTAVPHQEFGRRENATISLFDYTLDHGYRRRSCGISVTSFIADPTYSEIKLAMNTKGRLLSVLNTERYDGDGSWSIYDIRQPTPQSLVHVSDCVTGSVGFHFFTLDNDLALQVHPCHLPGFVRKLQENSSDAVAAFTHRVVLYFGEPG